MDSTDGQNNSRSLEPRGPAVGQAAAVGRVGVWQWEPETDFSHWNEVMREIVGADADTAPNLDLWLGVVHPEDRHIAQAAIESRMVGGEIRHRIITMTGEVRHVIVHSEKVNPGTEGGPDRYMGLVIDITENHEAATLVADTLESISDGYMALASDWTILYANHQSGIVLGRPHQELLGRKLWDEYPEALESVFFTNYRITMEQRTPTEVEDYYPPLDMWLEVRAYPIPQGIAVYFRDVTERHEADAERERMLEVAQTARAAAEEARKEAEHQAVHDSLTDLINRVELASRLDQACSTEDSVTLFFLDVDRFKLVNDSLGHAVGDQLLCEISRRLKQFDGAFDLIARFGGDEFVLAVFNRDRKTAAKLGEQILGALRQPVVLEGRLFHITVSVGVAESTFGMSAEELLLNADVTLYRAKETGRDRLVWFDDNLRTEVDRRVQLEDRLRQALLEKALSMHYQPAYDLATGQLTDVEALARWTDPEFGSVSPVEFIPIAEESGLIHRLGAWAAGTAAEQAASWHREQNDDATFWVNVSTNQLVRPDIASILAGKLETAELDPSRFGIEITETALVDNVNLADGLSRVAKLGINLAIDDFGTGFSSISRLRELPVDILKIDRSFIAGAGSEEGVETLAAIVDLAHALEATVIAEGVETHEEYQAVQQARCDRVSGYLFGRPVPPLQLADEIEAGRQRFFGE